MADNQVSVEISIEERAALRALTQLSKGVEGTEKQVQKSVGKMDIFFANFAANIASNVAGKAFTAVTRAFGGVINVFQDGIQAAQVQEDAINNLNSQLRRTGEFSEELSQDFQNFASELQQVTRFGDELILSQLSLAKAFGLSNEQSKTAVEAATNLSESLGISLDSAVRNLGKTTSGLVGELGELIPEIKTFSKEQLQAGAAIDFVAQKFEGIAEQSTRTFSGALQQAQNTIGDTTESLGMIVTQSPVVVAAIGAIGKVFGIAGNEIDESSSEIRVFAEEILLGTLKGGLEVASDGFIVALKAVNFFKNGIDFASEGVLRLGAAIQRFRGEDSQALETAAQKAQESIGQRLVAEEELISRVEEFKTRGINIINREVEAARNANQALQVENEKRIENEAIVSQQVIDQRNQLYNELATIEADKRILEAEQRMMDQERNLERRITEIETIKAHEQQKNMLQLTAQQEKNKQIQDAETRRLANQKAINQADLANQRAQAKAEQAILQARVDNRDRMVSGFRLATQQAASIAKKGTQEQKALSIASTIINSYDAGARAYRDYPFPANLAVLATTVAAGLQNVRAIQSQSFATGGVVGGFMGATGGADNTTANVRTGEMVLNASQQRELFNMANNSNKSSGNNKELMALANRPVVVEIDGREVARTVREQRLQGYEI